MVNIDMASSSDDDESILVKKKPSVKKPKKKKDVSTDETEDLEETVSKPVVKSIKKKSSSKTAMNKRKQVRSKIRTNHENAATTLNGNYWNSNSNNGRTTKGTLNNHKFFDENGDLILSSTTASSTDSSSDETDNNVLKSKTTSADDDDNDDILYEKDTFVTCRSSSNTFYLCQLLQNVDKNTKTIKIRWCSPIDDDGDDTVITIDTKFKLVYKDQLDPQTILLGIPNVIHNKDNTISLKKKDIVETKRLLIKSIRRQSLSSDDDMIDLSTERKTSRKKMSSHINFASASGSDTASSSESAVPVSTKSNKRKKVVKEKKPRKPRVKKQKRAKATSEGSDDEDEPVKPKKKAVAPKKTQLFKVYSNRSLKENLTITKYVKEPFFEDSLPVPFISSYVQSKLAIRAIIIDDSKLLKSLINDVDHVCSVHVARGLYNDLTAIHYAIKTNNIPMLKILLDDIKTPKKKRCSFPSVSMARQSTGRANIFTLGFRTAQIMASRGAKEGNNALNKDQMAPGPVDDGFVLILYALQNNCSQEIYDLLLKSFPDMHNQIYDNIHQILRAGHRKLAANVIGEIKDNAFHGFNFLHHQVLLYDNEDITINRASSVLKKTKANFMITPVHCAAINPNAKYLKQLLTIMPEYNILDKYERRPIHFAAACEGSDPLEYLLSKAVNFNDVDRGGNAPLHIACINGRGENAEILLRTAKEQSESTDAEDQNIHQKFGFASINRMNKARHYPLHLAVLNNHLNCVQVLLQYDANVDAPTSTSSGKLTPLMLACQKGYLNIVTYLIENGAKIEARDRFKRTPLIHACMCGHADIVSYLLRLGANANACDSSLNTALHYAIAYGWYFCVRLLLEGGANLNCANSWQTTCLAAGFLKGHFGLCDYLLTDHNADINFKTDDGSTLVMLTVGLEISSAVVKQLEYVIIKHKADCTITDANGSNAFHYLAMNIFGQDGQYIEDMTKKDIYDNMIKMAKTLLDHNCNPNQMNNKSQTPLMIALQAGNFILVDYLINQAKIDISSDISQDGKTLLHYFATKCDEYDLIQALLKLPVNDEIEKMGQIFDNNGRTPFHYAASKFNEFCQQNKSTQSTDELKKKYRSIVQMIEYCLESAECDPDAEIKATDQLKVSDEEENNDDDDEEEEDEDEDEEENEEADEENENDGQDQEENEDMETTDQAATTTEDEKPDLKLKETSVFSLLLTVSFIDSTEKHPLEIFLQKTQNLNVLHHKTHRTPLLESIYLQQIQTAQMLIKHPLCDINLSTSNLSDERQQTPLIFACELQLLPIIRSLLEHKQCNIISTDYKTNQAIHYYLQTSNRTNEYLDLLNIFIKKLKLTSKNALNVQGKHQRTPLHIAVYHNLGTIDALTDIEKVLIENGSDLLLKDNLGNIPLHNVFINKKTGDDPVELCVLIMKGMKYKSIDTQNNRGDTPLHLAVKICSTVCVMLLQEHNASLLIENNLLNSIIGTCIASGHLNLFITFIQQSNDINLRKLYKIPTEKSVVEKTEEPPFNPFPIFGRVPRKQLAPLVKAQKLTVNKKKKPTKKSNKKNIWKWKYTETDDTKEYNQHSLIYLIIERDWQGALSLILNDVKRFHLTYIQIIEAAILTNKLNLVLRLLFRLKDELTFDETTSSKQNLFHLLANMNQYDENLLKQILLFLNEYSLNWNTSDQYSLYPLHYACVKQNFTFINFLQEKYPTAFNLKQLDAYGNTPIGLLFWSLPLKSSFSNEKLRLLITSDVQLNCLCNYDNELLLNPLSFNYIDPNRTDIPYPPNKSNGYRTSPLIHAIVHNNFSLVQFLLELGADVNYPDENEQTPLMYAVRQNNINLVKLLLNKSYTLENKQTGTPSFPHFHLGRGRGRTRVVATKRRRFFLGATTAATTDETENNKNKTSTKFQVTSSINFNAIDNSGRTVIHHLIQPFPEGSFRNNLDILRLLHDCGASLTVTDLHGCTPLDYTIKNNYQYLTDELIKLSKQKKPSIRKPKIEPFIVNDPNKNLLGKPDYYNDAQNFIDEYILNHPISKSKVTYEVDRASNMSLTGEVVMDTEKNEPFDVHLTKTDISYGTHGLYNFYRMQIIKHTGKNNLFFLFTRWGRIGYDEGQHQLTPFSTLDECKKEFLKVFKEKTGNAWKDTDQFESKPKKYTLIRLNERQMKKYPNVPIDFDRLQAENEHPSTQLHSSIYKNLLKTFINRQAIRHNIHKTQLDVKWMPASQLQRETLDKARLILEKLKETIEKRDKFNTDNSATAKTSDQKDELKAILDSLYEYSNEFYTLIPLNNYSYEKLPVIEDKQKLQQKEKLLEDLLELELSYKILLGAQANLKSLSPLDYLYKSLNCQFEALNKNDIDSQFILRYVWTSSPLIQVEQVFKIARADEDERFMKSNIGNRYLLWHGTGICNLISILTRGLLVGSLVANATGSLFGTGIYTADTFAKSLGYCSGIQENDSERCFMLLCEVALGNVKEIGLARNVENDEEEEEDDEDDIDKPLDLTKYQSRKGVGRCIPDPKHTIMRNSGVQIPLGQLIDQPVAIRGYGLNYNEYIVYDEAQVAIRYLVQFRR